MTNEEYRELALRTAPDATALRNSITCEQLVLLLCAVGLPGETGEVCEIVKKHVFHGHPWTEETRARLVKELGDVEWYANLLRETIHTTPEYVHATNIAKLAARYPEGFFTTARSVNRAAGDE